MSVSVSVFSTSAPDINVVEWTAEAKTCLRYLLNSPEDLFLDVEVFSGVELVASMVPGETVFGFVENNILDRGGIILYGPLEDWEDVSDDPLFCFSISEIPRPNEDLLVVLCLALLISAAKFMGSTEIIDYHGIVNACSDQTSIDDLMNLRIGKANSLDNALKKFYRKLPLGSCPNDQ